MLLAVSLVLAVLRLGRIRRTRLVSGGALVRGISGAFFALDFGLARDIVVERRAVAVGSVRPKRGRGLGRQALVWREWQRLLRFPQPLFMLAVTLVVPYACDALGMSTLTPVVAALSLFGATRAAARRPAGADPDRWAVALPALLAGPAEDLRHHRAGHPGRGLVGPHRCRRTWASVTARSPAPGAKPA